MADFGKKIAGFALFMGILCAKAGFAALGCILAAGEVKGIVEMAKPLVDQQIVTMVLEKE